MPWHWLSCRFPAIQEDQCRRDGHRAESLERSNLTNQLQEVLQETPDLGGNLASFLYNFL